MTTNGKAKQTRTQGKGRVRIDRLLVEQGLSGSRERARAMIMAGKVLVDERRVEKAGELVSPASEVRLKGSDIPYVGRGGLKLEGALDRFGVDPQGIVGLDVGASTGGFTDCLLQRGARRVYAVDVGYGQLAWKLRTDSRVILSERTNARQLEVAAFPEAVDLAVIDVSFISLEKILPPVSRIVKRGGHVIALVKPQFEVGKSHVDKGGIVKDEERRLEAVERIARFAEGLGFVRRDVVESPIRGATGNREYFIWLGWP